jgi:hypothetical protein
MEDPEPRLGAAKERKMESCYIIMPITTPETMLSLYGNDLNHFRHVLDLLFKPAVSRAGMEPIEPSVGGSELIQGAIISNLEKASCVLCDMSTLNVFFELGIRTSLNKPVCLVRDDRTPKSPFDTSIINHVPYDSALHAWDLDKQVEKLAKHLTVSLKTCSGVNPLWKYFGMTVAAHPPESGSTDDKLVLIATQIEQLRAAVLAQTQPVSPSRQPNVAVDAILATEMYLREHGIKDSLVSCSSDGVVKVRTPEVVPVSVSDRLLAYLSDRLIPASGVSFIVLQPSPKKT